MPKLACVGGLTLDNIYFVPEFPDEDDSQPILSSIKSFGGRGALVALTTSMLGKPSSLLTTAGKDFKSSGYFNFLKTNNVDISGIKMCESDKSFNTHVYVTNKKEIITFFQPRNLKFGEISEQQYKLLDSADFVYFSINDLDFNSKCLDYVADKEKKILHNVCSGVIFTPGYLTKAMNTSNILICNEGEYNKLRTIEDSNTKTLFYQHPKLEHIIVTLSDKGSIVYSRDASRIKKIKISPIKVKRGGVPLGVGDAYSSGVVYGLVNGWDIEKSANLGSHIGAASFASNESYTEPTKLSEYVNLFKKTNQ